MSLKLAWLLSSRRPSRFPHNQLRLHHHFVRQLRLLRIGNPLQQNARAALRLADYGYVLENGAIVLEGPAAELASHDRVIESYLGLCSTAAALAATEGRP